MRTENKKKRKTRQRAVFFNAEKRLTYARIRVYMRIWAHNARKYAHIREIYYKKFC